MRATISQDTEVTPQFRRRFLVGPQVPAGEVTVHNVKLLLEITEEERALILSFQLGAVVLDDQPTYTSEEIAQREEMRRQDLEQHYHRKFQADLREELRRDFEAEVAEMKKARTKIAVADLLLNPFVMKFKGPLAATQFSGRLRSEILPKLRKLMDEVGHKETDSQTFEL